jgi:hypothetical protein
VLYSKGLPPEATPVQHPLKGPEITLAAGEATTPAGNSAMAVDSGVAYPQPGLSDATNVDHLQGRSLSAPLSVLSQIGNSAGTLQAKSLSDASGTR